MNLILSNNICTSTDIVKGKGIRLPLATGASIMQAKNILDEYDGNHYNNLIFFCNPDR